MKIFSFIQLFLKICLFIKIIFDPCFEIAVKTFFIISKHNVEKFAIFR